MGVTRAPSWHTLNNKPATVAALGLSDFNGAAIGAQAALTMGQIGSYALLFHRSVSVTVGSTYAGSDLRAQGMARAADNVLSTPDSAGPTQTGTWRALLSQSAGGFGALGFFVRIA